MMMIIFNNKSVATVVEILRANNSQKCPNDIIFIQKQTHTYTQNRITTNNWITKLINHKDCNMNRSCGYRKDAKKLS